MFVPNPAAGFAQMLTWPFGAVVCTGKARILPASRAFELSMRKVKFK